MTERRTGRRAGAAVLLALGLAGLSACGGDSPSPPESSTKIEMPGPDGTVLVGRELGDGPVTVVLAHGASTNMTSWYAPMDELAEAGYRVIAFDSRGVGDSSGDGSTDPGARVEDIEAVIRDARRTGAKRVVVAGSSLGAHAALLVAERGDVAAVVGVSPATVPPGADTITAPAFFVAAVGDTGPAANGRALGRELGRPATIVDGSVHGADLFADQAAATRALVAFLREAVPPD